MELLKAYPFATASSAAFYLFLFMLAIPRARPYFSLLFVHPIPPHQRFQLGFDALRGFAAAFVAFAHCWWATYPVFAATQIAAPFVEFGTKGVPVFAVLSGFLIYRSGLVAVKSVAALRDYIIRRFFRIYPVYVFGVMLSLLMGQYVETKGSTAVGYLVSDLFMLTSLNWPGGFANPPTWSLYVEVAFYAVLPLAIIAVGQRRMLAFCSAALIAWIFADSPNRIFVLWRYFFIGIAASEVSAKLNPRLAAPLFLVGVALLVYDFGGPDHDWLGRLGVGIIHPDYSTLGLGLGLGFVLTSLPRLRVVGIGLNFLPFRILGVISYSVYITHFFYIRANFPEMKLFTQAGTPALYEHFRQLVSFPGWYLPLVFFPGALFWGAISFLLVERPGMKLGKILVERSSSGRNLAEADASQIASELDRPAGGGDSMQGHSQSRVG